MDFKRSDKNKSSVFNVGWIVFLIMFGFIILSFTVSMGYLFIPFIGYIGAVVGNAIRIYAMPTVYTSNGTVWGSFYKRLYWSHGPQVSGFIGIFIIIFILGGLGSNG